MQKARFKMKSYSDNDITVFREYKEIYNTKTLLKNIIRIEFETFYNTSQSVKKQAVFLAGQGWKKEKNSKKGLDRRYEMVYSK